MEDLTAKKYLESKGLCDHDYMDSGMINHISEMMEEYHQAKLHLLNLPVVIKSCDNCKFVKECRHKGLAENENRVCKFYVNHVL